MPARTSEPPVRAPADAAEEPARTAPRPPDRIHAWTRLPTTEGLLDLPTRADGVPVVPPPAGNGSARIEVQCAVQDAKQAGPRRDCLHARAEAGHP
ncbi:hypothetical protein [Streptomyces sp. NPDC048638]|uniref:hypothetical protein n=1 Tax=Streptomyces sp. NPDC048638 TaxID=3365580 RepID=UPI003720E02C